MGYGILTLSLISAFALALRVWAANDSFWFDEIWSYSLALELDSVWHVFLPAESRSLQITTWPTEHHILNMMFMHLLGDQQNWFWYRSFSVVSGTGAVFLVGLLGLRKSLFTGAVAAWLMALSLPMVQYASEARGYAGAIFFCLLAVLLIQRYWRDGSKLALVGFWLASVLAVLSQLTAFYVYVSLGLWSLVRAVRTPGDRLSAYLELMRLHAAPVACLALLYVFVVTPSGSMGGTVFGLDQVLRETLALAVGAPPVGVLATLGVLLACGLAARGIASIPRHEAAERFFYASVLFVAPALALVLVGRQEVYVRYFVVCFPFFYLLVARVLDDLRRRGASGMALAMVLLLLISSGEAYALRGLLTDGRGHYGEALRLMAEQTRGDTIVVGSDYDFRAEPILRFYARYLSEGKTLAYVLNDEWPAGGVDWVIVHSDQRDWEAWNPKQEVAARGGPYRLVKDFRFAGLSGFHWAVYRNASSL